MLILPSVAVRLRKWQKGGRQTRAEGHESCQGAESSRWRPALGRPGTVRAQGADGVENKSGVEQRVKARWGEVKFELKWWQGSSSLLWKGTAAEGVRMSPEQE